MEYLTMVRKETTLWVNQGDNAKALRDKKVLNNGLSTIIMLHNNINVVMNDYEVNVFHWKDNGKNIMNYILADTDTDNNEKLIVEPYFWVSTRNRKHTLESMQNLLKVLSGKTKSEKIWDEYEDMMFIPLDELMINEKDCIFLLDVVNEVKKGGK